MSTSAEDRTTTSSVMTKQSRPKLLDLPRDVKWMIFDYFLPDVTARAKNENTYALPHEWPENPELSYLTDYFAIIDTCDDLRKEAVAYFKPRWDMVFYFDSLYPLQEIYHRVAALKPEYLSVIRFSLRTQAPLAHKGDVTKVRRFVDAQLSNFNPGRPLLQHFTHEVRKGWEGSRYTGLCGPLNALNWSCYRGEMTLESHIEDLGQGAQNLVDRNGAQFYAEGMRVLVRELLYGDVENHIVGLGGF
ncbi:hypothetical protein LTR37_009489 [Vermiconidia calcicola]|uniref:Uncharacterized protein n=1 Tax=Vermiconidia calcicola TaxID=1690605 RepID=A0ACC3NAL7_9PEZI|nr:hypothetical protein LTR37_009489 [Vermiconidia calcicola]